MYALTYTYIRTPTLQPALATHINHTRIHTYATYTCLHMHTRLRYPHLPPTLPLLCPYLPLTLPLLYLYFTPHVTPYFTLALRNIVNIVGEDTDTHIRMHALTYTYIRTRTLSLHAYTYATTLAYMLTHAYAPTLPLLSLFYLL